MATTWKLRDASDTQTSDLSLCDGATFTWWLSTDWEDPIIKSCSPITGGHCCTPRRGPPLCGDHFNTHAYFLLLGWDQCVLDEVHRSDNPALTVQNVHPTLHQPCVDSVLQVILFSCALTCVTWFSLALLTEGPRPQVIVGHSFSQCLNSSKACPKLYSNPFPNMCPLLSFCGQVVLKAIPSATSLV